MKKLNRFHVAFVIVWIIGLAVAILQVTGWQFSMNKQWAKLYNVRGPYKALTLHYSEGQTWDEDEKPVNLWCKPSLSWVDMAKVLPYLTNDTFKIIDEPDPHVIIPAGTNQFELGKPRNDGLDDVEVPDESPITDIKEIRWGDYPNLPDPKKEDEIPFFKEDEDGRYMELYRDNGTKIKVYLDHILEQKGDMILLGGSVSNVPAK